MKLHFHVVQTFVAYATKVRRVCFRGSLRVVSLREILSPLRGEIFPNHDSRFEPLNRGGAPHHSPFSPQRGEGLGMRGGSTNDREQVHGQ
jgi:hypothetical protein